MNHWKRTLKAKERRSAGRSRRGHGQGRSSFKRYENVMKVVDSSRPSDHNMVLADFEL